jgi:hypothetical protein
VVLVLLSDADVTANLLLPPPPTPPPPLVVIAVLPLPPPPLLMLLVVSVLPHGGTANTTWRAHGEIIEG